MKKVMLLCASHNDLGLINALRKLGYYIYATGNVPGLIGEKYVDEYIKADYSDKELILNLAKKLRIDNICACCNDYGVYTAAYVAENLGLSGYDSYATTLTLHNKDKFKQFAAENDIISPAAHSFSQKNEAMAWAKKAKLPLIVKPVDCSAGNGICKVDKAEMIESSVNLAFEKSRAGRVVIEDFIDGTQHGFCTYLLNQKVVAVCSNDEYSFANPYRVEIDTFPATGIERCQNILIEQVEKIAGILHLKDGIFHLQYIEDDNGPHIIEVMRRVLGNMYSVPANALMGFDWDYWEVRARMGLSCEHFPRKANAEGFFAYKAMLAKENGVITSINIPKQYNKYLIGDCIIRKPGDNITNFTSEPIGFLFMRFSSLDEMHKILIDKYENNGVQVDGKKIKKLLIVNAHWSNRGDEAALRAIIDSLRKRKPEWAIEVMFKDGKDITEFPYSDITYFSSKFLPLNTSELFRAVYAKGSKEIVKNAALAEAVQKCLSADMLVYSPGGSVICDRFWWIKQLEYLLPFACAKVYGIPLVVAAPSMGPFASWELEHWRNLVRHMLLSSAKTICLRECTSKQYLDEIFRVDDNNPAIVTIDSAFLDDAPVGDMLLEQDYELRNFLSSYSKIIGVTITDFDWHVKYGKNLEMRKNIRESYTKFINEMGQQNIGILLIPQLFGNQNDYTFLQTFAYKNTFVLSDKYDTYEQQSIISELYAVIGMRYHSNIFAAKAGIPFVAIAYEEKMAGFMSDWDLQDYMLILEDLSFERLMDKYELLADNHEKYHLQLIELRETWRDLAKRTVEEIVSVMDNVQ